MSWFSGVAAFLYVAALWYAAPAFLAGKRDVADRLRVVAVTGIAIPGVLALFSLLYAPLVWIGVCALVIWRVRTQRAAATVHDIGCYATLAATLLVLWPPLVRPLLDGDTLLYHLPNAVGFVQSHSIWTVSAPYWPYPPASELFAAGVFAASGRWSLPSAGIVPALLLTARLYRVARKAGAPQYVAASVPLAFICMPLAAFESGTLQNDVWLAAFFIEVLAAADRSFASIAVCALLKPFGWIESLIAATAARIPWRVVAIGFLPFVVWIARDAILLAGGNTAGFSAPPYLPSTIAGNFALALPQLAHGIAAVTPQSFVWFAVLFAGLCVPQTRRYAGAGLAILVLYAFLPLAYKSGETNYVVDASSLRFALPALASGALVAATLIPRTRIAGAIAVAGYALAAWGTWRVLGVFWNDAYTHWAILVAAIAVAGAICARRTRGLSAALTAAAILVAGAWGASSRAPGFYADWMRDSAGKSTGVFAWIAEARPARLVTENVRTGAVLMSSPATRAYAVPLDLGCEQARSQRALLFVGSNEDVAGPELVRAFATARSCGEVLYEDRAAVVVRPL